MNNFRRLLLYVVLIFVSVNLYTNWTHRHEALSSKDVSEVSLPTEMQLPIGNKGFINEKNRYVRIDTPKMEVLIDKIGTEIDKL